MTTPSQESSLARCGASDGHVGLTPLRSSLASASEDPASDEARSPGRRDDAYQELRREIEEAGCFRRAPWACGFRMAWVASAYALGYVTLLSAPDLALRAGAILLLAFVSVQAGFIAHDAVDRAITKQATLSTLIGQVFMSFATALSCSYFDYFHRLHHAHLSGSGVPATSSSTPLNDYESRFFRKLVSRNGWLFVVTMVALRGLSFRLESLRFLLRNPKTTRLDQLFIVLHAVFWLGLPVFILGPVDAVVNYVLVMLLAGPYIGTVLILNHAGMSAARFQARVPIIERTTRATRNLGLSRWNDFIFGGVNNHIEHHLFPDVPTVRLRKARLITREFCQRRGIYYSETSCLRALTDALNYFRQLSPQQLAEESLA